MWQSTLEGNKHGGVVWEAILPLKQLQHGSQLDFNSASAHAHAQRYYCFQIQARPYYFEHKPQAQMSKTNSCQHGDYLRCSWYLRHIENTVIFHLPPNIKLDRCMKIQTHVNWHTHIYNHLQKLKNTPCRQHHDSIVFSRLYLPTLVSLGTKVQTPICQNVNIHVAMLNHNIHDPGLVGCQIRKLKYQEQCWNMEKTDKEAKRWNYIS